MVADENDPEGEPAEVQLRLAAERTMLAWIRTGLALMGFGFVVARLGLFLRELAGPNAPVDGSTPGLSLWLGTALVLLGVGVNMTAAFRHQAFTRRLDRGQRAFPSSGTMGLLISSVLALIGLTMAVYLVSLGI
jgi:putative membrane protein